MGGKDGQSKVKFEPHGQAMTQALGQSSPTQPRAEGQAWGHGQEKAFVQDWHKSDKEDPLADCGAEEEKDPFRPGSEPGKGQKRHPGCAEG